MPRMASKCYVKCGHTILMTWCYTDGWRSPLHNLVNITNLAELWLVVSAVLVCWWLSRCLPEVLSGAAGSLQGASCLQQINEPMHEKTNTRGPWATMLTWQNSYKGLIQHFRLSAVMATNQNEEFVQLLYVWWRTTQQTFINQRPMGHNAHLNVQLWRPYSAKIL